MITKQARSHECTVSPLSCAVTSAFVQVIDLVEVDEGTVVHLRLLSSAIEDYHANLERVAARSA